MFRGVQWFSAVFQWFSGGFRGGSGGFSRFQGPRLRVLGFRFWNFSLGLRICDEIGLQETGFDEMVLDKMRQSHPNFDQIVSDPPMFPSVLQQQEKRWAIREGGG